MRDTGGARLIVMSPPYPDARTVEAYGGACFDTSVEGYGRLGDAVFEALMPGGVCALNIDGPVRVWRPEIGESERSLIAFKVAIDWAERVGFRYVEHCAYVRWGAPIGHDNNPRWRSGWEPVHVFARPGGDIAFRRGGATRPAADAGRRYSGAGNGGGGRRATGAPRAKPRGEWIQPDTRALTTAETFHAQHTDREHPAAFCSELADDYVLCYSQPSDIVGDPFVGSGTVAYSCHRHGRRFIGGDLGHRERDGRRWADIVSDGLRQTTLFDNVEVVA